MHLHTLLGCSPTPLAHYLKALGILRLVAEQKKDPDARGFWKDDAFCLATRLSEEELERFFLDDYAPTPVVTPWNGDSYFWDNTKSHYKLLECSEAPRFTAYPKAILSVCKSFKGLNKPPKEEEKLRRIGSLRSKFSEGALAWLDAVLMVGTDALHTPALLGTGGNDGRFEIGNNFMKRLMTLFDVNGRPKVGAEELLKSALWRSATKLLSNFSLGQFFPSEDTARMNPWDFVLMIEGAIVLQVSAVRRLEGHELAQAAAPFAVQGRSSGYASASAADGSKGRGEQWLPLWSAPARFDEVRALFAEGRLKSGTRTVRQPVEAALAIRRLGTARGVESFQRYGFIVRNGKSILAVPLGRRRVEEDPALKPLREVIEWCERLRHKTS